MKSKLLLVFIFLSQIVYAQKIVLDEDFNNNKNGWEISQSDPLERTNIISGRYDLYTLDNSNWHWFTISKEINERYDFAIQSVITKLPRDINYQMININRARQLLSQMNYTNKSTNQINEGLKIIDAQQSYGTRYNINPDGTYNYYFPKVVLSKSNQEELSYAMGFIKDYKPQLLFSNESYGLVWGGASNRDLFIFSISPEFKSFRVISIIDGKWTNLIDWKESDKIQSGFAVNKLSIEKINDNLYFYINDSNVGISPAQQFYGSKVGFFVGPETHISVDNLNIENKIPNSINETAKEQPVSSNSYTSGGSGVLISSKGFFATNYHVVENASEIYIETDLKNEKKILKAIVELADKNNDLAILKLVDPIELPNPTFNISAQSSDVGTSVFAMGYPLLSSLGEEIKVTDGIINSKTGYQGNVSTYQISSPIQPGSSGGALFDKKGNLVGITNAGIPDAQNIGYAVKSSYLLNLIDLLPQKIDNKKPITKLESLSFTEKIKELTKFVVIIKTK